MLPFHYPPYRLPLSLCIIRIIRSLSSLFLVVSLGLLFFSLLLSLFSLFFFFSSHSICLYPLSLDTLDWGFASFIVIPFFILYSLFFCLTTATYSHTPRSEVARLLIFHYIPPFFLTHTIARTSILYFPLTFALEC